ncbi:MAG: trypsin-like peptidase domain-containing protein, partial [Acetobacter sp.]|nr:trypsin-like peptidase domain-containing protein [Acetobacter sp.]
YYADKTTGSAKVLWKDAGLDLAILKSSRQIPYLRAGKSQELRVGEPVYALGTPLTLQFKHTVTKGIVSALNRTLEVESKNGSNFLQCLVQHDASINPGNSGGPLINAYGEVVGINTLKASEGEGLGFANPIEVGSAILKRIMEDESYTPPYLGVFGFDSDIAKVYGQALGQDGVYIVDASGPALEAGLQKGDVITALDEHIIKSMQDLRVALFNYDAGDKVSVKVKRDNIEKFFDLQLSKK